MVQRECTWCRYSKFINTIDMAKQLESYIESLPEEIKVSKKEHEERLAICSRCSANVNGLCRYCGCYIIARTVKKSLSCPYPGGAKWLKIV
jgi:hypothetical protein